jgi:hypothetical protein
MEYRKIRFGSRPLSDTVLNDLSWIVLVVNECKYLMSGTKWIPIIVRIPCNGRNKPLYDILT